jgi:hypothetical protein
LSEPFIFTEDNLKAPRCFGDMGALVSLSGSKDLPSAMILNTVAPGHEFNACSAREFDDLAFVASRQFPRVTIHYNIPIHGTSVLDFDDASPPAVPA